MFIPDNTRRTCAQAWLEAAVAVNSKPQHEANNVLINISDPLAETHADVQIMTTVDNFLRSAPQRSIMPLQSVANTIFPDRLYRYYGRPEFYSVYAEVYKRIRKGGDWGRYFERMIQRPTSTGEAINPLERLVIKMHKNAYVQNRRYRNVYELPISDSAFDMPVYDVERDANRVRNGPCLSFLSFKLDQDNRVMLTAVYRNHYYIQRLLGNLIGLARLMEFVGSEAEVEVGSLTVVSTHAVVETPHGYRRQDVEKLFSDCNKIE